jgi:hypothetical protein
MAKWVELRQLADGELSVDGETRPAGEIHIRKFIDGELVGGSYANYNSVAAALKEFFEGRID